MKRKTIILTTVLILITLISLFVGRYGLSFIDIITGNLTPIAKNVLLQIRMPRTFFVIMAGASLALVGFVYQAIFKNDLASPDILGVSSGASVGAIIGILFLANFVFLSQLLAFLTALIVVFISLFLAKVMRGSKLYNLVISGIIIGAFANSLIMFLKYMADPENELAVIDYWLMGGFYKVDWMDFILLICLVVPSVTILLGLTSKIKLLTLNDDEAHTLGINVGRVRVIVIILTTIIVATIVSLVGIVAWIGLIVPHLVRIIFKGSFKEVLIYSLFSGAILLLFADILARTISTTEIPISVLTSLIGAICLVFVLVRKKND